MLTAAEYRKQAEQCRNLAKLMTKPEDKKEFEKLAQTWEKLAQLREVDLVTGD